MTPVVSIVGKSNTGKTTFVVKLIEELKRRGYKVAVIKHNVHGFDIDHPGKDTYRHAEAGADTVAIVSAHRFAMIKHYEEEISVESVLDMVDAGHDLVITEGYKRGPFPKIEVSRKEHSAELISTEDELVALVTDNSFPIDRPHFGLDDAVAVANFLEQQFSLKKGRL
ncbi:MAG TPA: molybdopterin-guanine dinucleotide biosynthesis protein B [Candidatus Aquicultor sp.]|jgi:molybdopterin-guanine dinucleotide biosynthesis protein B